MFARRWMLAGGLILATGCATLAHGPKATVYVETAPAQALLYLDGKPVGKSPLVLEMSHDSHSIVATKAGHEDASRHLKTRFSGWALWSTLLLVAPLIVDVVTGAATPLKDDEVFLVLTATAGAGGGNHQTIILPAGTGVSVPGTRPSGALGGCSKDTDCKGNRVCENGACQDP